MFFRVTVDDENTRLEMDGNSIEDAMLFVSTACRAIYESGDLYSDEERRAFKSFVRYELGRFTFATPEELVEELNALKGAAEKKIAAGSMKDALAELQELERKLKELLP